MFRNRQAVVGLIVVLLAGTLFSYIPSACSTGSASSNSVFRIAEWPSNEAISFGDSVLTSDRVFPLTVYILSLPDVGNIVLTNHSAIVNGAIRAVEIYPSNSSVKELVTKLDGYYNGEGLVAALNVSLSYVLIQDWTTYKTIVEQGNDSIIVNTHDQYLPVPNGYTKEAWVDQIGDFMLNRWGTWVDIGGYPFYDVWYQNGTTAQWGSGGFSRMMSHIGKPDATCYPPEQYNSSDLSARIAMRTDDMKSLEQSWGFFPAGCDWADIGYPTKYDDFSSQVTIPMYDYYVSHSALQFTQNSSSFNFGVFVHLGISKFEVATPADFPDGFISTATAIFFEYRLVNGLYGSQGNSASEEIQQATSEGRTIGLNEAKVFFQKAVESYVVGDYKIAWSYAHEAAAAASSSTSPTTFNVPVMIIVGAVVLASVSISGVKAYRKFNGKKPTDAEETEQL